LDPRSRGLKPPPPLHTWGTIERLRRFTAISLHGTEAAFSAFEAQLSLGLGSFIGWCCFDFWDFLNAFSDVYLEFVANVVAFSVCVGSGCNARFPAITRAIFPPATFWHHAVGVLEDKRV
jgi:hypothetical protein